MRRAGQEWRSRERTYEGLPFRPTAARAWDPPGCWAYVTWTSPCTLLGLCFTASKIAGGGNRVSQAPPKVSALSPLRNSPFPVERVSLQAHVPPTPREKVFPLPSSS